jgi:CRP-like cAMP-binding protein
MDQDTKLDTDQRLDILLPIKVFSDCDAAMFEQAITKSQIRYFDRNQTIVEQGKSNQFLYWILKGEVVVEKEINLIEHKKSRQVVRPDTVDEHIQSFEKRTQNKISLGKLTMFQYFPEVLPTYIHTLDSSFDRFELIQKLNDLDQVGYNKSTVTVRSITPIECLVMNRIDFVRLMTWDMFALMKREGFMFTIPPRSLQSEWIEVREWKVQKQKLIRKTRKHINGERDRRQDLFQTWRNEVFEGQHH